MSKSTGDDPRRVLLPGGQVWPALGLGTWRMGESKRARAAEAAAVRAAIGMGYRLIDTAEMYGGGVAEEVVGEAIAASIADGVVRRDELFIVSKVYPQRSSRSGVRNACRESLARLGLDRIDAYLLHWRGAVPLAETVAGFEALQRDGSIGCWGVSNFDTDDMAELFGAPGGPRCAIDQIWYSLGTRGPEHDLLPWLGAHGVAAMAYSPIDQGALASHPAVARVAQRRGAQAGQVALAFVLRRGAMAIPKAVSLPHLRDNLAASGIELTGEDLAELDRSFPPPTGKTTLATT